MADRMVVRRAEGGYTVVDVPDAAAAGVQQAQLAGLVTTAKALPGTFAQAEGIHAQLGARIDQLAAAVAELAQRPPPEPLVVHEVDLAPLQDAVAALQAHDAAAVPEADVAPLQARLAAVEAELLRLAAAVAALPTGLTRKP